MFDVLKFKESVVHLKHNTNSQFPIQATCTDFLKTALRHIEVQFRNFTCQSNCTPQIILSAHDEVVVECAQEDAALVAKCVTEIMVTVAQNILKPISGHLNIEVEVGVGTSWADKP